LVACPRAAYIGARKIGAGSMKGVVLAGDRRVEILDFPDPAPGPGEVVIEIKASGMCGSDLKFYRAAGGAAALGFKTSGGPVIAGHEPCGVVAAVGPGVPERQTRVGMRVMQHHYRGCGVCRHYATGWMQLCVEGVAEVYDVTGHGAHAAFMKCPARTLVPLPDELAFETGAAISCGTGTAWGALHRLGLQGDDTIAIFGQGPVGLAATQLASAMGARVMTPAPSASPARRSSAPRRRSTLPRSRMSCTPSGISPAGSAPTCRSTPRPRRSRAGRRCAACAPGARPASSARATPSPSTSAAISCGVR